MLLCSGPPPGPLALAARSQLFPVSPKQKANIEMSKFTSGGLLLFRSSFQPRRCSGCFVSMVAVFPSLHGWSQTFIFCNCGGNRPHQQVCSCPLVVVVVVHWLARSDLQGFSPGSQVFSRYSGFLQVLWFSPGFPVFSKFSGFLHTFC